MFEDRNEAKEVVGWVYLVGLQRNGEHSSRGMQGVVFWLQKVLGSQTAGFPDRQEQSALEQTTAEMRRWHRGSGRNQQGGLLSVLPIPTLGCAQSVLFSRAALVNTAKLVSDNGFLNRFLAHQRCGVPVSPGLLSLIAALSPILLLLGCHCFSAVQILALFNCCRSNPLSQPWNEGGGVVPSRKYVLSDMNTPCLSIQISAQLSPHQTLSHYLYFDMILSFLKSNTTASSCMHAYFSLGFLQLEHRLTEHRHLACLDPC